MSLCCHKGSHPFVSHLILSINIKNIGFQKDLHITAIAFFAPPGW